MAQTHGKKSGNRLKVIFSRCMPMHSVIVVAIALCVICNVVFLSSHSSTVPDPKIIFFGPTQTPLNDWYVSVAPSTCFLTCSAIYWCKALLAPWTSASFCSVLFVSIACQKRKHGRRLTVQTYYIPAWAPMSCVSFSCCIALPYLAAIHTCRLEKAKLCFRLFRICHRCFQWSWHKAAFGWF